MRNKPLRQTRYMYFSESYVKMLFKQFPKMYPGDDLWLNISGKEFSVAELRELRLYEVILLPSCEEDIVAMKSLRGDFNKFGIVCGTKNIFKPKEKINKIFLELDQLSVEETTDSILLKQKDKNSIRVHKSRIKDLIKALEIINKSQSR